MRPYLQVRRIHARVFIKIEPSDLQFNRSPLTNREISAHPAIDVFAGDRLSIMDESTESLPEEFVSATQFAIPVE